MGSLRFRRPAAVLLAVLCACACSSRPAPEDAPAPEQIGAARESLGRPTIALADALIAAAAAVDRARHETPRGAETLAATAAAVQPLAALREAAVEADAAARPLSGPDRVGRAAAVVTDAAAVALLAADSGAAEAAALERLSMFDQRQDEAIAAWGAAGSQSQRRDELGALAGSLDALVTEAGAEPAVPEGCPALRDARVRWSERLAGQTRELAGAANSAGGAAYDELRLRFAADPYGEDRRAADAADRDCWARTSVLAQAAAGIRDQVETLESLLQTQG